jgi:hypothetical protein
MRTYVISCLKTESVTLQRKHAALSTVIARLDRAIQYPRDVEINSRSRGVLDTPHTRGMTIASSGGSAA